MQEGCVGSVRAARYLKLPVMLFTAVGFDSLHGAAHRLHSHWPTPSMGISLTP